MQRNVIHAYVCYPVREILRQEGIYLSPGAMDVSFLAKWQAFSTEGGTYYTNPRTGRVFWLQNPSEWSPMQPLCVVDA